jgi:hypothetical protein
MLERPVMDAVVRRRGERTGDRVEEAKKLPRGGGIVND